MPPLALSDDQLRTVIASAEPLDQGDRGRFLVRVAELLAGVQIGDVAVVRAARLAQATFDLRPDGDEIAFYPQRCAGRGISFYFLQRAESKKPRFYNFVRICSVFLQ